MTHFYGLEYAGNLNSYIDWCIYYEGAYCGHELLLLKTLAAQLPADSVFFDVGANVGNHSLFGSTVFGHVYAFEPVPGHQQRLEAQRLRNQITNLTLCPYALGEADAQLPLYLPNYANQGMGSLIEGQKTDVQQIEVSVRQGDGVVSSLGIGRVDVIKIDVEGFERQVLNGLAKTIRQYRPVVFFEWSEEADDTLPQLPQLPQFDRYSFFQYKDGRAIGLFFQQENFRLLPVEALLPHRYYVAIPTEKVAAIGASIQRP